MEGSTRAWGQEIIDRILASSVDAQDNEEGTLDASQVFLVRNKSDLLKDASNDNQTSRDDYCVGGVVDVSCLRKRALTPFSKL